MNLVIILAICLVVMLFIISLILTMLGQIIAFKYKRTSKTFNSEINTIAVSLPLQQQTIEYELSANETCYYTSSQAEIYFASKKECLANELYRSEICDPSYKLFQLTGYLNIKPKKLGKAIYTPNTLYVTNHRIVVIDRDNNYLILKFKQIEKIAPSLLWIGHEYHRGVLVFLDNKTFYKIIISDPKFGIIAHKLYKMYMSGKNKTIIDSKEGH